MRTNERRTYKKEEPKREVIEDKPIIIDKKIKEPKEDKIIIKDLQDTEVNPKEEKPKKLIGTKRTWKVKTEPKYECEICKRKFYNPRALQTHKLFKHS